MDEPIRIVHCSREQVTKYAPQVAIILKAIGDSLSWSPVNRAYVTDKSRIGDFWAIWDAKDIDDETAIKDIATRLGLDTLTASDYLWEVAEELYGKAESWPSQT